MRGAVAGVLVVDRYFVLLRGPESHSTLLRTGEFRMTVGGVVVRTLLAKSIV